MTDDRYLLVDDWIREDSALDIAVEPEVYERVLEGRAAYERFNMQTGQRVMYESKRTGIQFAVVLAITDEGVLVQWEPGGCQSVVPADRLTAVAA